MPADSTPIADTRSYSQVPNFIKSKKLSTNKRVYVYCKLEIRVI